MADMTMHEYQCAAMRTMRTEMGLRAMREHALHLIAAETGEIHGHYQKTYQGHQLDMDALLLEVGDLMWGIAELCTANNWTLEEVAQDNMEKLKRRYPEGFDEERSRKREGEA